MLMTLLASTGLYVGLGVGVLIVVIVVAALLRSKHKPVAGTKTEPLASDPPAAVDPAMLTPTTSHPSEPEAPTATQPEPTRAPAAEVKAEAKPEVKAVKPATLEVEALSPSITGEAPMLGAEADELRMATDEMPKFGTAEMPSLGDDAGPTQYRTPAARELSAAIASGECPKCKAPTFVGAETPEEIGADGIAMYKLEARCGACGHKANLIDMKAG